MSMISILDLTSVGIFGMTLSAAFCDISWTRKKGLLMVCGMAALLMFQGAIYFWVDSDIVVDIYPVITHFPLALILCLLSGKYVWPVISVLTAYFCCQFRRWLALFAAAVFSGGDFMQQTVELLITLPLLLALIWFIAPSVRSISNYPKRMQYQFGVVPALYYGFDYLTRVYTGWLSEGALVVVEFMPFVCSAAYLFFAVHISREGRVRSRLEQTQDILNLQVTQAVREIKALRELQQKTSAYRHDLRHHMQYLASCIENDRLEQAQAYIQEICSEIEANKVTVFCENEAVNLIFSAFAGQAKDCGVPIRIRAAVSQNLLIAESDLCVLLSNAMENALCACRKRKEEGEYAEIEVLAYEKNDKFFLQVINSCGDDITFEYGVPVTDAPGHGIGVRSICTIVEKYGGIYTFLVEDEQFILRISL